MNPNDVPFFLMGDWYPIYLNFYITKIKSLQIFIYQSILCRCPSPLNGILFFLKGQVIFNNLDTFFNIGTFLYTSYEVLNMSHFSILVNSIIYFTFYNILLRWFESSLGYCLFVSQMGEFGYAGWGNWVFTFQQLQLKIYVCVYACLLQLNSFLHLHVWKEKE